MVFRKEPQGYVRGKSLTQTDIPPFLCVYTASEHCKFSSTRNNSYCHEPLPYLYLPYCFLVFLVSRFKEGLCFVDQVSQVFLLQGKGGHKELARI